MYDVAVIGAGPTGSSAAVFTARGKLKTLLIDGDQSITRRAWIPNHLGFPEGISGPDLVDAGLKQAANAGAEVITEKVEGLERDGDAYTLHLGDGKTAKARQVILGLGANLELARKAGIRMVAGREPRFTEVIGVDAEGRTSLSGVWAAGACAGTSVHTIIVAGDGARVAINLVSEVRGQRFVDHEVLADPSAR